MFRSAQPQDAVPPALDVPRRRLVPGRAGAALAACTATLLLAAPAGALATDAVPPATLQFSPGPFSDLMPGYWALSAITSLAQAGLALTPAPHTFDPYSAETRGAWVEQVALTLDPTAPAAPAQAPFPDVTADAPAAPEIALAAAAGWIPFPTTTGFSPDAPITRQEAFSLLGTALLGASAVKGSACPAPACTAEAPSRALPFTDADQVATWAAGPIMALYDAGYISGLGDGRLDPGGTLERDDAAALLAAVLQHLITTGGHRYRVVSVEQMRATTYGNGEGLGGHTATGTPVHLGEAAADPAALPYGTVLFVSGYDGHGYLPQDGVLERIEDTGMLGPNDIDLYMPAPSIEPYLLFGVQQVTAYVLDPTPVM